MKVNNFLIEYNLINCLVLTVQGNNPETVELGDNYTDAGAMSNDGTFVSTDLNGYNPFQVGSYTIQYSATNTTDTATATRIVNVVDTTPPVITVTGSNPKTIELGSTYRDELVLTDTFGVDVVTTGSVDTSTVGTYTLTYSATDASGNVAIEKYRTVNVVPPAVATPPTITLNGGALIRHEKGRVYTDLDATAIDSNGNDISSKIVASDNIDINSIGYYQVTYNVNDDTNNTSAQAIRTVYVVSIAYCQGG